MVIKRVLFNLWEMLIVHSTVYMAKLKLFCLTFFHDEWCARCTKIRRPCSAQRKPGGCERRGQPPRSSARQEAALAKPPSASLRETNDGASATDAKSSFFPPSNPLGGLLKSFCPPCSEDLRRGVLSILKLAWACTLLSGMGSAWSQGLSYMIHCTLYNALHNIQDKKHLFHVDLYSQ